jgi:predicted DNA-binding transcriptional regulator AlpA
VRPDRQEDGGEKVKQFLKRESVAEYFDVTPGTIDRWVRAGTIPGPIQIGGSPRWDIDALLRSVVKTMNTQAQHRSSTQDADTATEEYVNAQRARNQAKARGRHL